MPDAKKQIENNINDIDLMISELDLAASGSFAANSTKPLIDINVLDVVDVLHNILN